MIDPKWFPCDRCGLMSPLLDRAGDPPGRCGTCCCGMHPEDVRALQKQVTERHALAVALAVLRDEWAAQLKAGQLVVAEHGGVRWGSAA